MCVPETFSALRTKRREFLKIAAGAALGTAMGGVTALAAPEPAEARLRVRNIQDLTS